ncbi:hypothetical protein XENTR_v10019470 [Xenopus tropicalis]|nr:hypothetical protein XENTR_v10019470 [Xenopus tropicalis]
MEGQFLLFRFQALFPRKKRKTQLENIMCAFTRSGSFKNRENLSRNPCSSDLQVLLYRQIQNPPKII